VSDLPCRLALGGHADEIQLVAAGLQCDELHVEEPLEFGEWSAPSNRAALFLSYCLLF